MIREAELRYAAARVTNYIEKYVTCIGAEKREEVLELFDNMRLLFPHWAIATCPIMHPEIRYASKNFSHVFGYSNEHMLDNSAPEKYFSHIHSADQQDMHTCLSYMHDYLESISPEEHTAYRSVFHYRFKKENGQYIYLHDEKATLNLRGAGNLYYTLFRDITTEKPFNGVKVEIFKQDESLNKIIEYKPLLQRTPLSKREGELVTLIKQGLSTKEIAWYLNISHNTVRNIKSKLFEKYNVSNSIELLNMTG